MKARELRYLFASICMISPVGVSATSLPFEMQGIHIGQSVNEAKKKYPSMQCDKSCTVDGLKNFGKPGLLWAGLKDGKISQLAFRFKPAVGSDTAKKIRDFYIKKYGPASDHLGINGCDEWKANGGYLAICLSPELSHIWWSTESRVDINIQNQRKQK